MPPLNAALASRSRTRVFRARTRVSRHETRERSLLRGRGFLEADLPQVASDHACELQLAARRERNFARRDHLIVAAVGRTAPHATARALALHRSGPPMTNRVARLKEVLRRRLRVVLETLLAPHLAATDDRRRFFEAQVVFHIGF